MSDLKFSVADWCFFRSPMEATEYYEKLRSLGYAAVEFCSEEHRETARAAGLQILNLGTPGMQDGLNRQENHAHLIPEISKVIASAKEQGIPQVVVFSGNRTENVPEKIGWENCRIALEPLAKEAEAAGVMLVLEILNSFEHTGYQADSSKYAFDLVKGINSPALRVLYDIYHVHRMGEDVFAEVMDNLPWVGHFHIAGSPKRDYPAHDGAIDYHTFIHKAQRGGYNGYWGLEFLPREEDAMELLGRFIKEYGNAH